MAPQSILIIGCGIAGPVLATFLLRSSIPANEKPHITIVERFPAAHSIGQNIDIREAGVTVIRKLGLESAIHSATTKEEGVHFVDENNHIVAENPADKTGTIQTGTSDIEILRGTLADICYKRSKEVSVEVQKQGGRGIDFYFGETVETIVQDGDRVHVTFIRSRQTSSYDLVIGADGLMSNTRRMVWGRESEEERIKPTGMYAAFFSMPRENTDTMWRRWFITTRRRNVMLRPSDRPDKTTVSMMTMDRPGDHRLADAAKLSARGVDEQKALVEEYFQDVGWESKRVLKQMYVADDFYFNMIAQIKMDKWSKGRVVLLGDAAFCPSPFSGRGTTLALEGAYHLAGALSKHPHDLEAAFDAYESSMRSTVDKAQKWAPLLPKIIAPETALGVWILRAFAIFVTFIARALMPLVVAKASTERPKRKASFPVTDYGFKDLLDHPV